MDQNKIRNFVIIAHIDHGKSTLADRFLEITKTIPENRMHPQYLDSLELEKEKQITIKLAPVRMQYLYNSEPYTLNLIDTPGHVDFSYEVSRSLAAVEGAVLLVDAVKGIQAQTLAVLEQAQKLKLEIIPVINKIDLPQAETDKRQAELAKLLNVETKEILKISAKTGLGVGELLNKIITNIPAPKIDCSSDFKALIFDSIYNPYQGAIAYVRVFAGEISTNQNIKFLATDTETKVGSVGVFAPDYLEKGKLSAGEIGYLATNIKKTENCQVGDTIALSPIPKNFKKLPGYLEPRPNIFVSLFSEKGESEKLKNALSQLKLNDSSLQFQPEHSSLFGSGFRGGFLGMLHLEIVKLRIEREYHLGIVFTTPSVSYNVLTTQKEILKVNNPDQFPDRSQILEISEPIMEITLLVPNQYLGPVAELLKLQRAKFLTSQNLAEDRSLLTYEIPLSNLIWGFYDQLKTLTSGLGSYNWRFLRYQPANLVKLDFLISGQKFPAFSQIVYQDDLFRLSRAQVAKLKKIIPRQLFEVSIQAVTGAKVIARENIPPLRKDVIAKLYGGDYTRKRKLLEKQKAGKKRMKMAANIKLDKDVFWKFLK